jgi:hypothetical protein
MMFTWGFVVLCFWLIFVIRTERTVCPFWEQLGIVGHIFKLFVLVVLLRDKLFSCGSL